MLLVRYKRDNYQTRHIRNIFKNAKSHYFFSIRRVRGDFRLTRWPLVLLLDYSENYYERLIF